MSLKNFEIARILENMAFYLEMFDEIKFKIRAFQNAAKIIESLPEDVADIYRRKEIRTITGIGPAIAEIIGELVETGTAKVYEEFKEKYPVNIEELSAVEGLGSKRVKLLYDKLKIKNLEELEKAAKEHRIRRIKTLGIKTEKNLLKGVEFAKKSKERLPLVYADQIAKDLVNKLGSLSFVERITVAGSYRRKKETVGDLDMLVVSKKPEGVMDYFTSLENVGVVLGKGPTKSSVLLKDGLQVDVRVFDEEIYGSALLYFTGSKEHNVKLRIVAIEKGLKLSEYGVFRDDTRLAGRTEEESYKALGLSYIEPELREDLGEVEAAKNNSLPQLVQLSDIKGDFHVHSNYSDGMDSISDLAKAAQERNYEYICISDHVGSLKIAGALNEEQLMKQMQEIDQLNNSLNNFRILKSAEVNINAEGELDLSKDLLKKLDVVLGALHSGFKASKEVITRRVVKTMESGLMHIFVHPTGRIINRRTPYDIDLVQILEKAKESGTILEINAFPERLDLRDIQIKSAVDKGVNLAIGTDSHNKNQLSYMEYGVYQARRGWCTKKNLINTLSIRELEKLFDI
ncbi:MAG: DNA polymerase/3'-5' exonuclease PolX [Candidatus Jordarchaeum sp.]|uniref:DNA polymerase/3'-5' exonuclease PolX n=1 Tax=Candidatus Jordarchaeum sp. TaxID=2823881 RepID=UPI00404963CC